MGSTTPLLQRNEVQDIPKQTQSLPLEEELPYWQINVPPHLRTPTCPPYLLSLSPKDLSIISAPDSTYKPQSWTLVRSIIRTNRLDQFQRVPSALRLYLSYTYALKQEYESVSQFILTERLGWEEPIIAKGGLFEYEEDVKVLENEWPYGVDERIVHLVVWTKFWLEEEEGTDDLKEEVRERIQRWVGKVFGSEVGEENVIWWKNWKSLKSVGAVEHFHVMLYDPDLEFVKNITNGGAAVFEKVSQTEEVL